MTALPCRCGEVHEGHDLYTYGHHNCFHDDDLVRVVIADEDEAEWMVLCPLCGKHWYVES